MSKMIFIEEAKVQQALEALEFYDKQGIGRIPGVKAIAALREALEEQPAKCQPLTDEWLYETWDNTYRSWIGGEQFASISRAIEAAHGIGDKK